MKFEWPLIEVIELDVADIVTASIVPDLENPDFLPETPME